jgi:hypothetical protein
VRPSLLIALLLTTWTGASTAAPRRAARRPAPRVTVKRETVERGIHWRIATANGVLHLFKPPGYWQRGAGIVVYVHGYHLSADRAWATQHLAEQFRASRQNALFVVVDGPSGPGEPVKFPALGRLLVVAASHARLQLPRGQIVVIGHSGAYRTLVEWLDYRFLGHVILLDALYAHDNAFFDWMTSHRHSDWHRLTVVARDTLSQSRRLAARFKGKIARLKRIPERYADFTRRQRAIPTLLLESQYDHSGLVTNGKVIPLLLRLTRLRLVR